MDALEFKTEIISLLLFLQDPSLRITALAHYIVKARLYSLILENDLQQSALNFETNSNLTLRVLLKNEQLYIRLALKIVQVNEEDRTEEDFTNILILDKLKQHEGVLRYLIKVQRQEFERKLPQYFVLAD
jgi:hypothetical protein